MEKQEAMESLLSIVMEVGKGLFLPAKRHAGYLFHYKRKVNDLKSKVDKLGQIKTDLQVRISVARRNEQLVHEQVTQWFSTVHGIEADATRLVDGVHGNRRCFKGWCPDWCSNYNLGKEAAKKMADVDKLQTEGRNFNSVSNPPPPSTIESWPVGDVVAFKSRDSVMEKIIKALEDGKINIVGVFGMGGVGKTTLVKEVGAELKKQKAYNEVIMATVSQEVDVKKIQQEIGVQLGLKLNEEENESARASWLLKRLKQEGKVLIILDDVWSSFELAEIGIPSGDDHKGFKILLTTRNKDVCDAMGAQEIVEIVVLQKEEPWNLFKRNAGNIVDSPALNDVAKEIVDECGGLPLVIVTLGKALRNKDNKAVWIDALQKLRKSNLSDIGEMDKKVFTSLKLSYDFLGNEKIKSFFLLCCLFPEDSNIEIDELVDYGIGEGLLDDVDTLMEARDEVRSWVEKLKGSCLLLVGDEEDCVKMHDVVRDVAIIIASQQHGVLVQPVGKRLTEWPERNLEKCKRISVMQNDIVELSNTPECSSLHTLLLQRNRSLENIATSFFEGMKGLRVLILKGTRISSLPQLFQCLTHLGTLDLSGCAKLEDISLVVGLTKIEILRLAKSGIRELPKEISQLKRLKLLDLTETENLEKVPANVISALTRLEELRMGDSFSGWEIGEGKSEEGNANIKEVVSLPRLSILHIHVKNVGCVSQDISGRWKQLTRFRVAVGHKYRSYRSSRLYDVWSNCMVLENLPNAAPNWIKALLERVHGIELVQCRDMKSLMPLETPCLNNLKSLLIYHCNEMRHLISAADEISSAVVLESLESLHLQRMNNFERFHDGMLPSGFLGELRFLDVNLCEKLMSIFQTDILKRVQNLEKMSIFRCRMLKEVFHFQEPAQGVQLLSKLKSLELYHVPELRVIWKGTVPLGSLSNLEKLSISEAKSMRCLFSSHFARNLQRLETINIYGCSLMESIISKEEEVKNNKEEVVIVEEENSVSSLGIIKRALTFGNLRKLTVVECDRFKNLVSSSLARGLPLLEVLEVRGCRGIEDLIVKEEEEEVDVEHNRPMLPMLKTLRLRNLPMLKCLYNSGEGHAPPSLDWPSLTSIFVSDCPELKSLNIGQQSTPNLKEIIGEREWFDGLEWQEQEASAIRSRLLPLFKERDPIDLWRHRLQTIAP